MVSTNRWTIMMIYGECDQEDIDRFCPLILKLKWTFFLFLYILYLIVHVFFTSLYFIFDSSCFFIFLYFIFVSSCWRQYSSSWRLHYIATLRSYLGEFNCDSYWSIIFIVRFMVNQNTAAQSRKALYSPLTPVQSVI